MTHMCGDNCDPVNERETHPDYNDDEAAVIAGEYPDIEAAQASRHRQIDVPRALPFPGNYGGSGPAYALDMLKTDLIALLAYNWRDEEADYYRSLVGEDDKTLVTETHIFPVMQRLNVWVTELKGGSE